MYKDDMIAKLLENQDTICDLTEEIMVAVEGRPVVEIMVSVAIAVSNVITDGAPSKRVAMQSVDLLGSTIKELIRQSDEDGTAHWTLKLQ